jgi:uncharacterized protein
MSGQAPIDALQFAREGGRLEGEIPVARMSRLQDLVAEATDAIRYCVQGGTDARRRPVIDVRVEGSLRLVCQRCLDPIEFPLQRSSRFVLVSGEAELPDVADEDPDTETVAVDALADIEDVVEQEVLLGLPIAPMHEDDACGSNRAQAGNERPSPFAALAQLKQKP